MKKFWLSVLISAMCCSVWSQIQVNTILLPISKSDTLYTFSVQAKDLAPVLQNLQTAWGNPTEELAGSMRWEGVNMADIGSNLTVKVVDGVLTSTSQKAVFKSFTNAKNKEALLKKLAPNQTRQFYFTIQNGSQNAINTPDLKNKAIQLLKSIVNTK